MDLFTIEKKIMENKAKYDYLYMEYHSNIDIVKKEKKELLRLKSLLMLNVDIDKVTIAEEVLLFRNGFKRFNKEVISKAIADIAGEKDELRSNYFGVKDYAHWSDQEIQCSYGMGPRHGSVVFSVGFSSTFRRRELSSLERSACIYYLTMLSNDASFRNNAKC